MKLIRASDPNSRVATNRVLTNEHSNELAAQGTSSLIALHLCSYNSVRQAAVQGTSHSPPLIPLFIPHPFTPTGF